MCDSLGQSDQKVTVFILHALASKVIFPTIEDVNEEIKNHIEELPIGESIDIVIEKTEMFEHELDEMPEFEGY